MILACVVRPGVDLCGARTLGPCFCLMASCARLVRLATIDVSMLLFCSCLNYSRFVPIAQLSIAHPARSESTDVQTAASCRDVSDRSTDSFQMPPDQPVLILFDSLSDAFEVHVNLILSCHYPRDNRKQTLLSLATAKIYASSSGVTYVLEKGLLLSWRGADQIHN